MLGLILSAALLSQTTDMQAARALSEANSKQALADAGKAAALQARNVCLMRRANPAAGDTLIVAGNSEYADGKYWWGLAFLRFTEAKFAECVGFCIKSNDAYTLAYRNYAAAVDEFNRAR